MQRSHPQKSYLMRIWALFIKTLGPSERLGDNSNFRVFPSLTAPYIHQVSEGRAGFAFQNNNFYYLIGDSNTQATLRGHRIFHRSCLSPSRVSGVSEHPQQAEEPQNHSQCHTASSVTSSLPLATPVLPQKAPTGVGCLARSETSAQPRQVCCKSKLVKKAKQPLKNLGS